MLSAVWLLHYSFSRHGSSVFTAEKDGCEHNSSGTEPRLHPGQRTATFNTRQFPSKAKHPTKRMRKLTHDPVLSKLSCFVVVFPFSCALGSIKQFNQIKPI